MPAMASAGQRVLVVEDDPRVATVVVRGLTDAGFSADTVTNGADALPAARRRRPDLVLLDLNLPSMSGLEVCRRLKQSPELSQIPIVVMTAQASDVDRIVGLELGVDDYIGKPFNVRELVLRVQAVLRRTSAPRHQVFAVEGFELNVSTREVSVGAARVTLTAKEFDLLSALVAARGRPLSRAHLMHAVWGEEHSDAAAMRTVDVHIRRLRRKLGPVASWIVTLKHVGYRFLSTSPQA